MTIVKLNKKCGYLFFLAALAAILVFGGGFAIFEYNGLVDARHDIVSLKERVTKEEERKDEIANDLFLVTGPVSLSAIAEENTLILEKKPEYLEVAKEISASVKNRPAP